MSSYSWIITLRMPIIAFLDAATWLAQIAMFVLFGLLAWPSRLPEQILPALGVALTLMLIARPAGVFLSLWPYRFSIREKLFISWVGLRGAVGFFLASMPLLVGLKNAQIYFDVGFIVAFVAPRAGQPAVAIFADLGPENHAQDRNDAD